MIPVIVVPDVNVILSGLAFSNTPPSLILKLWRQDKILFATSFSILRDLERAFNYPKVQKFIKLSQTEIQNVSAELLKTSIIVPEEINVKTSLDSDDDKLFSCAFEAKADYIVSGDKKHVLLIKNFRGIKIVSPKEFVQEITILNLEQ
ncbi:MAG: putative toxin-antitoxin system toxin component, PIN family [Patescibacteria group bacterium]